MPEEIKKVCRQGTREKRAGGIFILRCVRKKPLAAGDQDQILSRQMEKRIKNERDRI